MPPLVIVRQLELCMSFIVLFYFLPWVCVDNNLVIFSDVIDKYMGALLKVLKIINLKIIQPFYRFFFFNFYDGRLSIFISFNKHRKQ